MINGFSAIDDLRIHHKKQIGKFRSKVGKIGIFCGCQNLTFFKISIFQHLCIIIRIIVSKFERKLNETFDFIAHSVIMGFARKILIFDLRALPEWP